MAGAEGRVRRRPVRWDEDYVMGEELGQIPRERRRRPYGGGGWVDETAHEWRVRRVKAVRRRHGGLEASVEWDGCWPDAWVPFDDLSEAALNDAQALALSKGLIKTLQGDESGDDEEEISHIPKPSIVETGRDVQPTQDATWLAVQPLHLPRAASDGTRLRFLNAVLKELSSGLTFDRQSETIPFHLVLELSDTEYRALPQPLFGAERHVVPVESLDAWLGGSGWRVAARPTSEFVGIIRGDVTIRATVAPLAHISHRACERCTWACNYKVLPGNPNIDAMMGLALNPHVPIPADKHAVQYHVYARIVKLHFSMEKEITFARHWHRLLVANALLDDA